MTALLIIDVQNDFTPGGALAVAEGDEVISLINELQKKFDFVVATQDWHPSNHGSFAATHKKKNGEVIELEGLDQILWPTHCVQGSKGAEFHPDLEISKIRKVFQKGQDVKSDSYSGFFDNAKKKDTGLGDYLKEQGITEVVVVGLATDYCVKFTVLDALDLGFKTTLVLDACRGVDLNQGDVQKALEIMERKGAKIINSDNLVFLS
ncbi:MAG: nicotinamidase/pyrazinamidase [Chlamydiales bacterium]|jgi:nicotinamidase/pyrazinamidase